MQMESKASLGYRARTCLYTACIHSTCGRTGRIYPANALTHPNLPSSRAYIPQGSNRYHTASRVPFHVSSEDEFIVIPLSLHDG